MMQPNDISLDIDEVENRLYRIQNQLSEVLHLLSLLAKNMNAYKNYASNPSMDKAYAIVQESIRKIAGKSDQFDHLKNYIEKLKECEYKYQHCAL